MTSGRSLTHLVVARGAGPGRGLERERIVHGAEHNLEDPAQPLKGPPPMGDAATSATDRLRGSWGLLRDAGRGFKDHRGPLVSAAVAFYTLLAVSPLLVVALAMVGAMFGTETEREELARKVGHALGYEPAPMINDWLVQASKSPGVASAVGIIIAVIMSTRLFTQLEEALDEVWDLEPRKTAGLKKKVGQFLKRRLMAFAFVGASGLALLALLLSRTLIEGAGEADVAGVPLGSTTVGAVQVVVSIATGWVGTAVVYRLLPRCEVPWRSAWIGGLFTSILMNAGFLFLGWYVGVLISGQSFGPTGAFVFLLIWLYYSAQIFLLGANVTRVHAREG